VIEAPAERTTLVKRCTEQAVSFIERHQRQPFFLYVPHTMPGSTPHPFASEEFQGRSLNGMYGDAVEELDWSTGQIMATLQRLHLDRNTLFIWTSDNGAVQRDPPQGSCAPYRGFGYNTSEGAMRMPCVMRWPARIPAGKTCDALCSTLDLLPTLAGLASAELPKLPIDGLDLGNLLTDGGVNSPRDEPGMLFYMMDQLQAVRSGPWKLYLPLDGRYSSLSRRREFATAELYNVRDDVGELQNVAADHPEIVRRLQQLAERGRNELGDEERTGNGQRPAGWVETPQPLTMAVP
jgi:arylsulfatase A